jgi:phytoene synthase
VAGDASSRAAAEDPVVAAARAGEPDRYLAALLAPQPARAGLLALAAFSAEIARVPFIVTGEPIVGEIRLQWWRDALAAPEDGTLTGNPVADALRAAVVRHTLPRALLLELIDARSGDVAREEITDAAGWRDYLWRSEGGLFALATCILAPDAWTEGRAAAAACGQAYGAARLLLGLGHVLARGRVPLPQTRLEAAGVSRQALLAGDAGGGAARLIASLREEARIDAADARARVANLPREARPAFLPLALVEPYLRAVERRGLDVLRQPAEIAPLTRVRRIAAARWLGRF